MGDGGIPDLLLVGGPPFFAENGSPRRLLAGAWRTLGGRVLYVELMGDGRPFRERAAAAGRPVEALPGLWVERLEGSFGLPWSYPEALRRHHLRARLPRVREALRRAGFERDAFVALFYGWFWDDWIGRLGARLHVYDCVDEHRAAARVAGRPRREAHVWAAERRMIERVDLLTATSEVLLEDRAAHARASRIVPHAVDVEGFAAAVRGGLPEPPVLRGLPSPRAMLMGNLQPKLDFGVLAALAAARPRWGVALVGGSEPGTRLPSGLSNLRHLGRQPYTALPGFLAHAHAGLVPLLENAYNRASSPLKLLEYLAAGLPVVAGPNPVVEVWAHEHPEAIRVVQPGGDWIGACEAAFETGARLGRDAIARLVRGRTYEARVRALLTAAGAS